LRLKGLLGAVEQHAEVAAIHLEIAANCVFIALFQEDLL